MKNLVKYLLYLSLFLSPAGFFARMAVPAASPAPGPEITVERIYGGAYLLFAGKFGGEISRKEIAGHSEVRVDGCAKGSQIFQFTLHITKGGNTVALKSKSNVLTADMIAKLKSLSKGDYFEFRNTKAHLPNGKDVVNVHARRFYVV